MVLLILTFIGQIWFLKPGVSGLSIFLMLGLYGLGNGLVLPSLLNMALKSVPTQYAGAAAGVYSTFQQIASALGVSIIGGLFYYFVNRPSGNYQQAFDYGLMANIVCLSVVGLLLYLLPNGRPVLQSEYLD